MQPRSELLEKAFNKLMSCGNSRCCVCSLMESPNPFSKFQRKKLDGLLYQLERESPIAQSPLTVIVKRTMVKLPMSLLPLADPDCSDSSLITCSECNICVHRCKELHCASCFVTLYIKILSSACYGAGGESDGDGNWICQRCLARATRADCCLCLLRGGALKPTDGGQWAHLTCAMAIPEVSLGGAQRMQPVMTEAITRATRKMVHYSSRQKCLVIKCIVVCDTCAHFL